MNSHLHVYCIWEAAQSIQQLASSFSPLPRKCKVCMRYKYFDISPTFNFSLGNKYADILNLVRSSAYA